VSDEPNDTVPDEEPSAESIAFWEEVGIEPVGIDLPADGGFTLRHYVETDETEEAEEVPVFLGSGGAIHLFRSPKGLVDFIRSDAPHDLSAVESWDSVRAAVDLEVVPQRLNRYELDLVVEIARAGASGWGDSEREVLLLAGEIARDMAYYTERADLLAMLAPGSPLDDLDDDLRAPGRFSRRKLRKYNPDQIALSWRRIVRELETVVHWHD
jgi:hypothetical protein